jgi:hypothetical protein
MPLRLTRSGKSGNRGTDGTFSIGLCEVCIAAMIFSEGRDVPVPPQFPADELTQRSSSGPLICEASSGRMKLSLPGFAGGKTRCLMPLPLQRSQVPPSLCFPDPSQRSHLVLSGTAFAIANTLTRGKSCRVSSPLQPPRYGKKTRSSCENSI